MGNKKYISILLCVLFIINVLPIDVQASSNYAIGNVNIISNTEASLESVEQWARSKNATDTFINLAKIYKKYSESRGGVNWVLAYVQAAKETGYGRFGGVLDESYHNPCGLKNPQGGDDYDPNAHKKFDNWEQGVIAHLDHLALYAGASGYPKTVYVDRWKGDNLLENETYDPRHTGWYSNPNGGIVGTAKDAISLGGKWAPSETYGLEVFRLYCDATSSKYLPMVSNLELPANNFVIEDRNLIIKGWALHAFGIKEVNVALDGVQIATMSTGLSRADVSSVYPDYYNSENSGFYKEINIDGFSTGNKKIEVTIVANNGDKVVHTRNIIIKDYIEDKLPKRSNLEDPKINENITGNTLNIRGWALDSSGIKEVRAYVDGKDLGTIKYGNERGDVNNVYPGYPNGNESGFEGTVDISSISAGNKKLTVQIMSNDGTIQSIDRIINIERLLSRSNLEDPKINENITGNTLNIRGWALDSSGIKEVRAYVDGKDLGTIKYGNERGDVNNVYPGYPNGNESGFEGTVDISSISAGNRTLTVKITANDGTIQSIDRIINIERLLSRSNLEDPKINENITGNTLNIRGWALDSSGIKEVRAYVDGKDLGTIKYGNERGDVNNVYPGYPNGNESGFEGSVDISSISAGNKTLTVQIMSNDGTIQSIDRIINIERLLSRSNLEDPKINENITGNTLNIRGWALDSSGIKEVRAYVDGKDLGTIKYGNERGDVNNVYPGYPNGNESGFEGSVDISSISAGNKTLTVKITANDGTIQSINRDINREKLIARSNLEDPKINENITGNTLNIRGWALDSSGIKEVRAYVDGKDLGTIKYGNERGDVNNVYPGYPNGNESGFEGSVDISSISAGNKILTVKMIANDGSIQTFTRTIVIEKLESMSWLDNPITNSKVDSNTLNISGWALAGSGIKEVRAYIDGKDLGTVPYGTFRPDVNTAHPGYSSGNNSGFEGTIDISSISVGNKKVTIKITANDGTIQNIERNFVYKKSKLVVVDPGHDIESVDPGAVATHNGIRYIEGNLNLQIAIKLKAQLEAMGIEVYMTRYEGSGVIDKDSSESLRKRVKVANEMNADFFVSIHHNSFTSSSANGFEVYYSTGTPISVNSISTNMITEEGRDLTLERASYNSRSTTEKVKVSKAVAEAITNEASSQFSMYNRGAKDSNYYVCKNTTMPAVLVENGFITNPTEAAKVSTSSNQQKLAEIIAKRIKEVL